MTSYVQIAKSVERTIAKFGAPGFISRSGGGSVYDPETGETSTPAEDKDACQAVTFPYSDNLVDGTLIQRDDKQVFVSTVGLDAPKNTDTFIWPVAADGSDLPETETFTVVKNKRLAPNGENVLYELQVRK